MARRFDFAGCFGFLVDRLVTLVDLVAEEEPMALDLVTRLLEGAVGPVVVEVVDAETMVEVVLHLRGGHIRVGCWFFPLKSENE